MFDGFSIDTKRLAADLKGSPQLFKNKNLTDKILGYLSYKKDFDGYAAAANAAYEATKDPSYIQKLVDIHGYTQNLKEQKNGSNSPMKQQKTTKLYTPFTAWVKKSMRQDRKSVV